MRVVKAFSIDERHVAMLREVSRALGVSASEAVRVAIELLYSLVGQGTVSRNETQRLVVRVEAPVNINVVRAEARSVSRAEARVDARMLSFLMSIVNPPRNLVPPPPWVVEEAKKLLAKLIPKTF